MEIAVLDATCTSLQEVKDHQHQQLVLAEGLTDQLRTTLADAQSKHQSAVQQHDQRHQEAATTLQAVQDQLQASSDQQLRLTPQLESLHSECRVLTASLEASACVIALLVPDKKPFNLRRVNFLAG